MGGYDGGGMNEVDEYDGSSWTAGGNYPASVYNITGIGTQTAALGLGGTPGILAKAKEYNGSTWSEGGDLPADWAWSGGAGTQTAAISAVLGLCATYNGTAWAEVGDLNTPRREGDCSSAGTSAATSYYAGGDPGPSACEEWDDPSLVTATFTSS